MPFTLTKALNYYPLAYVILGAYQVCPQEQIQ